MVDPSPNPDGAAEPAGGGMKGFVDRVAGWVRDNFTEALITAGVAFGLAWFINVYVVAVRYEGTVAESGGTATVAGNWLTGSLFWLIFAAIVATLVSYGRRVGPQRMFAELAVLPRNFAKGVTGDAASWSLLLFGAALSLVIAILFGAAAAGISGVALLLIAASPVVAVLGRSIRRLGIRVLSVAAGEDAERLASASAMTSVLGGAAGMVVAWQFDSIFLKLVIAAIALAAAVLVLRRDTATAASVVLGLFAVAALRELFDGVALADDGGWQEGGGNLTSWVRSAGATTVMENSTVAGAMSGGGAVVGAATGQVLAATVSDAGLGGLSGEWGAADAGVEPVAPTTASATASGAAAVPPPIVDDAEQRDAPSGQSAGATGEQGGDGASGEDAGSAGDQTGDSSTRDGGAAAGEAGSTDGAGSGEESAGDDDAGLGGLSGQWSGEGSAGGTSPPAGPKGGTSGPPPPPAAPPSSDDEERP